MTERPRAPSCPRPPSGRSWRIPATAKDGDTCAAKLAAAAKVIAQYYGPDPKVSLSQVAVSGDRATGVIIIAGQSQDVTFEREDGEWKLGPDPEASGSTTTP